MFKLEMFFNDKIKNSDLKSYGYSLISMASPMNVIVDDISMINLSVSIDKNLKIEVITSEASGSVRHIFEDNFQLVILECEDYRVVSVGGYPHSTNVFCKNEIIEMCQEFKLSYQQNIVETTTKKIQLCH